MKEPKLKRVFSDNMVFQRDSVIRVFGECDDGDEITVSFDGEIKKAVIKEGKFTVEFEPHTAGEGYTLKVSGKEKEIVLNNICVGEVWIAGGQSNMEFLMRQSLSGTLEFYLDKDYDIRSIRIEPENSPVWETANEKNNSISAVAYYFSKVLKTKLNVPVGIINMNKGASSVLHWTDTETSLNNEITAPYVKRNLYDYGKLTCDKEPDSCYMGASYEKEYGYFYEKCVKDIEGFNVKGVLWYQGESDAGGKEGAEIYKTAFSLMLSDWKKNFSNEKLPFITTLLGNFAGEWIGGKDGKAWAYMRETQVELSERYENVHLISAMDCANFENIHPLDKQTVGKRMAACALNEVYGLDVPYKSPKFDKAVLEENKLTVYFKDTYSRIFVPNSELFGFEVKDAYRVWHSVNGRLEGQTAVFDVSGIFKPQYVRAYFKNACDIRVYNNYGNPLFPFGSRRIKR